MHNELQQMLSGYSLTTAEILYRLPDHPSLLQSYIWQEYDLHPKFPKLHRFLGFWETHLEGKLYRVRVAHRRLVQPAEVRLLSAQFKLN
jgi:uncharacterized protein Usg